MGLKKDRRLRNNQLFQKILKKGQTVRGSFLALYWLSLEKQQPSLVGFAVGKKLGNAVQRNKLRRRLRSGVRQFEAGLRDGQGMVWLARRYSLQATYWELQVEMAALLRQAGLSCKDVDDASSGSTGNI